MKVELYNGGGDQYLTRNEMLAGMAETWFAGYGLDGMTAPKNAQQATNECIEEWHLASNDCQDTGRSHMDLNGYTREDLVREFRGLMGEEEPSRTTEKSKKDFVVEMFMIVFLFCLTAAAVAFLAHRILPGVGVLGGLVGACVGVLWLDKGEIFARAFAMFSISCSLVILIADWFVAYAQ